MGDLCSKHFMRSRNGETKERFIERVSNCYIKPYKTPYWEVEICDVVTSDLIDQ
jgi:hypothetical protein